MFDQLTPRPRWHCLAFGTTTFIEELERLSKNARAACVLRSHMSRRLCLTYAVRFTRAGSVARLIGPIVAIPQISTVLETGEESHYV